MIKVFHNADSVLLVDLHEGNYDNTLRVSSHIFDKELLVSVK